MWILRSTQRRRWINNGFLSLINFESDFVFAWNNCLKCINGAVHKSILEIQRFFSNSAFLWIILNGKHVSCVWSELFAVVFSYLLSYESTKPCTAHIIKIISIVFIWCANSKMNICICIMYILHSCIVYTTTSHSW